MNHVEEPSDPIVLLPKAKHQRHNRHYIPDPPILEVEDRLFRIPFDVMRGSPYFNDMLGAEYTGKLGEGSSDDQPIVLQGITAKEMEGFLDVIFASLIDGANTLDLLQLSAALHLSTIWSFDDVRDYAIGQIESRFPSQDPFDRLDLAFKCSVDKWRLPAYTTICERETPLTEAEGSRLGFARFAAVSRLREKRRGRGIQQQSHCAGCNRYVHGSGYGYSQSCQGVVTPATYFNVQAEIKAASDLPLQSAVP